MAVNYKFGEEALFYVKATPLVSASYSTSGMTLVDIVKSVNISLSPAVVDLGIRANVNFMSYVSGRKDLTISGDILNDSNDAGFQVLAAAAKSGEPISIVSLDKAGGSGPAGNFIVSKWDSKEDTGAVQDVSYELKPHSYNGFYPGS